MNHKIKKLMIILPLVLATLLTTTTTVASITTITAPLAYGQEEEEEEEEEEAQDGEAAIPGGDLEDSDGALTARINGEIFTTGDTITVTGSVEERDPSSRVSIEVIDPSGQSVRRDSLAITADNTFTISFEAGERQPFADAQMEQSGNYRLIATFFPPGGFNSDSDNPFMSQVEFTFAYTHVEPQQQQQSAQQQPAQGSGGGGGGVNTTALNSLVIQGLEHVQRLNNTLSATTTTNQSDNNSNAAALEQLEAIKDTFMNIRGNLTAVAR